MYHRNLRPTKRQRHYLNQSFTHSAYKADDKVYENRLQKRLMILQSKDREGDATNDQNDYSIQVDFFEKAVKFEVEDIKLPTLCNVTAFNNVLDVTDNGGTFASTVAAGCYDGEDFATALETELNSDTSLAGNPYTVSYDPNTLKFQITTTDANGFTLLFGTGGNRTVTMAELIGFPKGSNVVQAAAGTLESTQQSNLLDDRCIFLEVDNMNSISTTAGHNNIAAVVTYSFDRNRERNFKIDSMMHIHPGTLEHKRRLKIKWTDEDENLVDFGNRNHTIVLAVYTRKNDG